MRKINLHLLIVFFVIGALLSCNTSTKNPNSLVNTASAQNETNQKPQQVKKLDPYNLTGIPYELLLDGRQLQIVCKALRAFEESSNIPKLKKKLENYNVELRQDEEVWMVTFFVKKNSDKVYVGGETENGVDVTYSIDKKTENIIAEIRYK